MLSPAVLVVFVLSPDPAEPTTPSFENAAFEVLGPSAAVRVETLSSPLGDAAALDRAGAADGVVEMNWDAARESVLLHCYIASQERWIDRTIHFGGNDRDAERGRLMGFAVASMFMDAPRFAHARAEQRALEAPPVVAPGGVAVSAPEPRSSVESPATASPASSRLPPVGRSLEFAGVGATGSSGTSVEVGASAALRLALAERLWLRVELSGRAGEIPAAQANIRRALAGLGVAWSVLPEERPIELGLRADVLGTWMQVAHLSSDDVQRVHHHRWLLGGDAVATLGLRFSNLATFYVGVGMEALLGRTFVYTHGLNVATEHGLRGLAEVGFRTSF